MELFKESLENLASYLENVRAGNNLREYDYNPFAAWPEKQSLVLREDTAVELGSARSLFMVLWTGRPEAIRPGRILLIGPDPSGLADRGRSETPFTQVVLVQGSFRDDYETYRELRDTVFDTRPEGVSMRFWPDRQKVWCRVGREALDKGFNLMRYGCALIKRLGSLPAVKAAEVIFATEAPDGCALPASFIRRVGDTVEALQKMYEETHFDCESCEYNEVCEEVEALREIRERLRKERGNGG